MTVSPVQVIGCTRLSSAVQELGYGQDAQVSDIQTYAKKHGLSITSYVHEVMSGAAALETRDVVQEYYKLARKHPGVGFIFPRVDRLGRLAERIITIARELCDRQARVYVVGFDRPLDPSTPDWLMFQFKALMAEQDYVGLNERLGKGKLSKAQRGLWSHGKAAWGYRLLRDARGVSTTLEPDPELAPAVLRCWELRADFGKILTATKMHAEGWPAPREAGWNSSAVDYVTRNTRYLGTATFQGIPITYPAIVPRDLGERVLRAVQDRRRNHAKPSTQGHLLTGHARCAECGSAMTWLDVRTHAAKRDGTQERYGYYRCWQATYGRGKSERSCNHRRYYRDEVVEAVAWDALIQIFTSPDQLAQVYRPPTSHLPDHHGRLAQLREQMATAFARAVTMGIPDDVLTLTLKPMRDEQARLEREMQADPAPTPDLTGLASAWRNTLSRPHTHEEQRRLLADLRVRFSLAPDGLKLIEIDLPAL